MGLKWSLINWWILMITSVNLVLKIFTLNIAHNQSCQVYKLRKTSQIVPHYESLCSYFVNKTRVFFQWWEDYARQGWPNNAWDEGIVGVTLVL